MFQFTLLCKDYSYMIVIPLYLLSFIKKNKSVQVYRKIRHLDILMTYEFNEYFIVQILQQFGKIAYNFH